VKVHNLLPKLIDCLSRWERPPTERQFLEEYFYPIAGHIGELFDGDGSYFYTIIEDLDWPSYRLDTLKLSPEKEERRLMTQMLGVEKCLDLKLEGEAILFGAFTWMDGYARFEKGSHQVFLGVDESHDKGGYLDVLLSHELTHVARESRSTVWEGYGLDPKMSHDEFVEKLPPLEHLMNEGFSCVISELLNPGLDPWLYAYQNEEGLKAVCRVGRRIDQIIHSELKDSDGDYGKFYQSSLYAPDAPAFTHYVWAWQWVKHVLNDLCGGDPKKLVSLCSKDFMTDALQFRLPGKIE
jgi:hypothetical protein